MTKVQQNQEVHKKSVNTLPLIRKVVPSPPLCLGTVLFKCKCKSGPSSCSNCLKKLRDLRGKVFRRSCENVQDKIRKNKKFLSSIDFKIEIEEAAKIMFQWENRDGISGKYHFLKEKNYTLVIANCLFKVGRGIETDQTNSFDSYVENLQAFAKDFNLTSLAKNGIIVTYINKTVDEEVQQKLRKCGIRIRMVTGDDMPTTICEDKKTGPMLIRYLAFIDYPDKSVFIVDADMNVTSLLTKALDRWANMKDQPDIFRTTMDTYYIKEAKDSTYLQKPILGQLFGLRGEPLRIVGSAYKAIMVQLAADKVQYRMQTFPYGSDEHLLGTEIFPLIKRFKALTLRLSRNPAKSPALPKKWKFEEEEFYYTNGVEVFHINAIISVGLIGSE